MTEQAPPMARGLRAGGRPSTPDRNADAPGVQERLKSDLMVAATAAWVAGVKMYKYAVLQRINATAAAQGPRDLYEVYNDGNGNCVLHTIAHLLGYLSFSDERLTPEAAQRLRMELVDMCVAFMTGGKLASYDALQSSTGICLDSQLSARANAMNLIILAAMLEHDPHCKPEEVADCLRLEMEVFARQKEMLPVTWLSLVAIRESIRIIVWQRSAIPTADGSLISGLIPVVLKDTDIPLSFAPPDGSYATQSAHVLYKAGGRGYEERFCIGAVRLPGMPVEQVLEPDHLQLMWWPDRAPLPPRQHQQHQQQQQQ